MRAQHLLGAWPRSLSSSASSGTSRPRSMNSLHCGEETESNVRTGRTHEKTKDPELNQDNVLRVESNSVMFAENFVERSEELKLPSALAGSKPWSDPTVLF